MAKNRISQLSCTENKTSTDMTINIEYHSFLFGKLSKYLIPHQFSVQTGNLLCVIRIIYGEEKLSCYV
jgi:hypothetical protein